MTSPSDKPRRPSMLNGLAGAFAPRQIDFDPDSPNELPKTVKIAGLLALGAGLLNVFAGFTFVFNRNAYVQTFKDNAQICKSLFNGQIGDAIPATETSADAVTCRASADATTATIANFNSAITTVIVISIAIGLGMLVGGWFLRKGSIGARRSLAVMALLLFAMTVLNFSTGLLMLLSGVMLIAAMGMCFVGKGANYFIRAKAAGRK
ncbi:hypothetical protein EH165_12085 [Nakamurella antarctica]|uniref:DUF4064 domain-containing protein n=1 Tax=Nakamurella antarctica TaxID=1902245 RepID=A0A3G8ZYW7_9ACTN|nr:hypothetical protein [Nakamurella antarctica]AZI58761.1 hypothetical protein EH165_12085 [Nakamurella antarctica]